jgi:hypothetical protein
MRAVSREDFLKLGGTGLIDAMLAGTAGCNRSHGKVVRFVTGTRETAALEGAVTDIQVDRLQLAWAEAKDAGKTQAAKS